MKRGMTTQSVNAAPCHSRSRPVQASQACTTVCLAILPPASSIIAAQNTRVPSG